jgi:ElaB/YqjD/DUF883 family membrane-anchored ribosome-binding protein
LLSISSLGSNQTNKENHMEDQFNKDASQGSFSSQGTGTAARMKEEVTDKLATAKEKVGDFGRKAVDAIDAQRGTAAGTLDKTASALHQTGEKVGSAAHVTGDKIHATADYVRQTDVKGMMNDIQGLVKRYPGRALAAVAVVGFLLARVFRGKD